MGAVRHSVSRSSQKVSAQREILRRPHKDDFHEQREHGQDQVGALRYVPHPPKEASGRRRAPQTIGVEREAIRKIAVATDLSLSSRRAVDLAIELSIRFSAELVVVHCVETTSAPYPVPLTPDVATLTAAARKTLDTELKRVREAVPTARKKLLHGSAAERISAFVEESSIDLLVFGTTAANPRGLLGTVAEMVADSTDVHVLVVRERTEWLG